MGSRSPWEGAILRGKSGGPIVKHRDSLPWAVQKWLNRLGCCLGCRLGIVLDGGPDPHVWRGNFEDEKALPRTCWLMSNSWHTESDSAGTSTGTLQMPIGCTRWGAHWRNMLNVIQLFVDGGLISNYFHHLLNYITGLIRQHISTSQEA